ncbi:MAG: hypothetical protein E6538_15890 [Paeniclostridium sordellii]|nr:hypothetical protein [Paeniclostridium sordellii]
MEKITCKKLIQMDLKKYTIFIKNSIDSNLNDDYFYRINKEIRKLYRIDPDKSISLFNINLKQFDNFKKTNLYVNSLSEIIKTYINNYEIGGIIEVFPKLIKYICKNGMYKQGKSIIDYVDNSMHMWIRYVKEDEYIQILKYKIDFYVTFKKFEEYIDLICKCAFIFSSNCAFQSAYRLLSDAQAITTKNNLTKLQFKVLITQASICLEEGDYKAAEIDFNKAYRLSKILNLNVPFELIFNMMTLMIRRNDYEKALEISDTILTDYNYINKKYKQLLKLNKSICLRENGKIKEAIELIEEFFSQVEYIEDLEVILEAHLVAAKSYLADKNYCESLYHINESIDIIEFELLYKNRLHYRRGYKENYIKRIIPMMLDIASNYNIKYEDITRLFIFTKSNMFSDWFSLMDWYNEIVEDELVEESDKIYLNDMIEKLINFGAPILNGFREKYDDPFSEIDDPRINPNGAFNYDKPWKELNICIEKITHKYDKYKNPFKYSETIGLEKIINNKISNLGIIISLYIYNDKLVALVLSKYKCEVIDINKDIYLNYIKDLYSYQNKYINISQFSRSLKIFVESLNITLELIINSFIKNKMKEVIIVQDALAHNIPLVAALISNSSFCEYVIKNEIIVKNVPVIYNGRLCKKQFESFIGIIDPANELPLFLEELSLHKKIILGSSNIINLNENTIDYNEVSIKKADIIHIATHGYPISNFKDPTYSSIARNISKDSLSFEEIQRSFWKLNYSLCINASCDSADFTNRNFQRNFRTNELIGYPTLFLMN